jgi:hypothetical protein
MIHILYIFGYKKWSFPRIFHTDILQLAALEHSWCS